MRSWFTAGAVEVPVPPFDTPRMPERAVMDGDVVADMMPFVAWTKPFREEARVVVPKTFSVPVAVRFVEVTLPVMKVLPTTVKTVLGVLVPMPTAPINVDVAVVDVATNADAVEVAVDVIAPMSVMPWTDNAPMAVKLPLKYPLPVTDSACKGVVVPMPILPLMIKSFTGAVLTPA